MKKIYLIPLAVLIFGAACSKQETANTVINSAVDTAQNLNSSTTGSFTTNTSTNVAWSFTGTTWMAMGTPPSCPNPLVLTPPTNLSTVTSILYPGQTRGGQYKPHGGFRFDVALDNGQTVVAPMDAMLVDGARYIEQGETQYLLEFINSCGIKYRFDHLLTLSSAMQKIVDTFPSAKVDDSRTTNVQQLVTVKTGDVIATAVGFTKTSNVAFDFGVYDLRQKNTASENANFVATHNDEQAQYALCWLDLLPSTDQAKLKALPGADQVAGKTSDYCTQ